MTVLEQLEFERLEREHEARIDSYVKQQQEKIRAFIPIAQMFGFLIELHNPRSEFGSISAEDDCLVNYKRDR